MLKNKFKYYIVVFKFVDHNYYTLWHPDNLKEFIIDSKTGVISFSCKEDLSKYAKDNRIKIAEEQTWYDCDTLKNINLNEINCSAVLDFWNIVIDLAHSIQEDFLGATREESLDKIYNKLFYGCNLPTIRHERREFKPVWNNEEKIMIMNIISDGLRIIEKAFKK